MDKKRKKRKQKSQRSTTNEDGESDFSSELLKKIKLRTEASKNDKVVVVENCDRPSARAYFSATPISKGKEVLMYGGEYFDGKSSNCFDDLFSFSPITELFTKLVPTCSPPPRCSHQAVSCTFDSKEFVYIFGGEFSTAHKFYHYRDMWEYSVETKSFKEIYCPKGPSPRSGHRMILYKQYLVLFGGFYETNQSTLFYNDVLLFCIKTKKWISTVTKSNQKPVPRSACHMFRGDKDDIYILGGYSKKTGTGVYLNDLWQLQVNEIKEEVAEIEWKAIKQEGRLKSMKKSGSTANTYRDVLVTFGGVEDIETEHDVLGEFSSDIYIFNIPSRKWYLSNLTKSKTFKESRLIAPLPRIGAASFIHKEYLYILYGTCETGKTMSNFDDIWKINLKSQQKWECVYNVSEFVKNRIGKSNIESSSSAEDESGTEASDSEIEDEAERIEPRHNESLRDYFERTKEFWLASVSPEIKLSEKETRKLAFNSCKQKYNALTDKIDNLDLR